MVRLRTLLANILFSKQFAFLLLVIGFVCITHRATEPNPDPAKYDPPARYAYGDSGAISIGRQGGVPIDGLDAFDDDDANYAFAGFHSSHLEPGGGAVEVAADDDHVVDSAGDDIVRRMSHDIGLSVGDEEAAPAHRAKSTKTLHFSSSHHAQVGQGHVMSDDKHGAYVPHTGITSGHGMRDPYYSMHVRETEIEKMKTVSVFMES